MCDAVPRGPESSTQITLAAINEGLRSTHVESHWRSVGERDQLARPLNSCGARISRGSATKRKETRALAFREVIKTVVSGRAASLITANYSRSLPCPGVVSLPARDFGRPGQRFRLVSVIFRGR